MGFTEPDRAVLVAAIQHCATTDVARNLDAVERLALEARDAGAEVVMTAEAFAYIGPDRGKRALSNKAALGPAVTKNCAPAVSRPADRAITSWPGW